MNPNELREKRAALIAQAREILDAAGAEDRDMTAEEQETFDKIHADADKLETRIATMEKQAEVESKLAESKDGEQRIGRPDSSTTAAVPTEGEDTEKRYSAAYGRWLRHRPGMNIPVEDQQLLEQRVVQTAIGGSPYGGYTIPQGFRAILEEAMLHYGPMPSAATVMRTSDGATLYMPTSNDTGTTGALLAEGTQLSTATDPVFGRVALGSYMYTSLFVYVSYQLLTDSAFNLESYLARALGERLGRILNTQFTTGTGTNQPNGVVTASHLGVTAAAVDAITADELIDLYHSLDPAYRVNASWQCADSTLKAVRQLKEGNGQYMWQPGLQSSQPDTLLGKPIQINTAMAALATGNKTVIFGDMSKYIARLVGDVVVVRDDSRRLDYLEATFLAFQRADGDLLDAGTYPVQHLIQA